MRKIHADIVALALEAGMRADGDLDKRIARRPTASARKALPLESQCLPRIQPCRNRKIERAPVRHRHAPAPAIHRIEEVHFHPIANIFAALLTEVHELRHRG